MTYIQAVGRESGRRQYPVGSMDVMACVPLVALVIVVEPVTDWLPPARLGHHATTVWRTGYEALAAFAWARVQD